MSNIPLPALSIQPPQQPDLLGQVAKVRQIQAMGQEQQLRGQQIQTGELENQMRQRDLQDQQTTMQILGKHNGDLESALPELASSVSAKTFLGLQKSAVELKKTTAELDNKTLENKKLQSDQFLGLIGSVSQMDEATYRQNWPQIAARALEVEPELKGHVDPNQPIPQQMLQQYGMLFQTQSTALAKEAAQRAQKAQEETARHNQATEKQQAAGLENNVSEAKLAFRAAQGDPDAAKAMKLLQQQKQASRPVNNIMTSTDAKDIADAIENGDQPPTLQGLYRNAGPVRAELARRGVPMAKMETDWKATQKYVGTLNGTQQVRLRQAIETASDSVDKIDQLYKEYHSIVGDAGMKAFNKAGLATAKQLPGRAGAVATALDAQIADLTSELGNVYMGGNSPTDHSLSLAGRNLSSDWNRETFEEGIKQVHLNIGIRKNSITHAQPAGLSGDSNYFKPDQSGANPTSAPAAQAETRTYQGHTYAKQPDGTWKMQ
jgi:hypothetical protein